LQIGGDCGRVGQAQWEEGKAIVRKALDLASTLSIRRKPTAFLARVFFFCFLKAISQKMRKETILSSTE